MRTNQHNLNQMNSGYLPQNTENGNQRGQNQSSFNKNYQSPSKYDAYQPKNEVKVPNHILERRNQLQKIMIESGQMDRLQEYLRKKLIAVGWKEDLKNYCKDLIREKGIQRVTVQFLMEQLQNRGKHMIPVTIKEDMIGRVRKFIDESQRTRNS